MSSESTFFADAISPIWSSGNGTSDMIYSTKPQKREDCFEVGDFQIEYQPRKLGMEMATEIPASFSTYRLISLLFSAFILTAGVLDILYFLFSENYFVHPYFALTLIIGSIFLLASTILAIKDSA